MFLFWHFNDFWELVNPLPLLIKLCLLEISPSLNESSSLLTIVYYLLTFESKELLLCYQCLIISFCPLKTGWIWWCIFMVKYTSAPFLTQNNNPESKVWFSHHFRMFSSDKNRSSNPFDYLDWQFEIGWIIYCSVCGTATISGHSSMFCLPKYLPWGGWHHGPKGRAWWGSGRVIFVTTSTT